MAESLAAEMELAAEEVKVSFCAQYSAMKRLTDVETDV